MQAFIPSPQQNTRLHAAFAQFQTGHKLAALTEFCQLSEDAPEWGEPWHLRGLVEIECDQQAQALASLWRATALTPGNPVYLANFGLLLSRLGRLDHAIAVLRRALQLAPSSPETAFNLANVLRQKGLLMESAGAYEEAVRLRPAYTKAMLNRAHMAEEVGEFDVAEQWLRRALSVQPDYYNALNNLGNVLRTVGRPEEAIAALQAAVKLSPNLPRAWNNLGSALRELKRTDEAIEAYRQAIRLKGDYPEARMNLGMSLLGAGNYAEGWAEFEYRWQAARELKGYVRSFAQPQWCGEPLQGKTLLVHAEQGFGDALQFFRYAVLLRDQGARVVVESHAELVRLFALMPGFAGVYARDANLPAFDLHCPFMSLPHAFGTRIDTIPANIPYLQADAADIQRWQSWLGPKTKPRVGLVWKGNPRLHDPASHQIDRRRSLPLAKLLPVLAQASGIEFICLQKGHGEVLPTSMRDPTSEFRDFADTAALVTQLDLVITVDTSMAHLAGGLARPVWMLSRFDACWRWLDEGESSAWYPGMRIFRQAKYGDWAAPLQALADALPVWQNKQQMPLAGG